MTMAFTVFTLLMKLLFNDRTHISRHAYDNNNNYNYNNDNNGSSSLDDTVNYRWPPATFPEETVEMFRVSTPRSICA